MKKACRLYSDRECRSVPNCYQHGCFWRDKATDVTPITRNEKEVNK